MPWTLYRYILKELLRLMALSLAVLVVVISFAAAIKPLSEGLLDPWRLILFVLLSIPTMLTLVAPFAAAFSSTLVFSRLTSDNEVVACAASGISYRTILLPVFVMGLVLTLTLYWVSNWIVPWFYHQTALLVQKDVASLVVSQVQQGRPVEMPNKKSMILYADAADIQELPTGGRPNEAFRRIMLVGVMLGEHNKDGRLRDHYAAEQADIDLYQIENRTFGQIDLKNVVFYQEENGEYQFFQLLKLKPIELPNPFKDDPRFLSWPELRRLSKEPQRYSRVAEQQANLTARIAREYVLRRMTEALSLGADGGIDLLNAEVSGTNYVLSAPNAQRIGSKLELTGSAQAPVRLEQYENDLRTLEVESQSATIQVNTPDRNNEPDINIQMHEARVRGEGQETFHSTFERTHALWPEQIRTTLSKEAPGALLARAEKEYQASESVMNVAEKLDRFLVKIGRQILAQVTERFALAFASLLVLLLGAVMSMKLKGAMPLVVYFWSFLLASLAVFITRSGENVATSTDYPVWLGPVLIWTGNVVLMAILAGIYQRLARN